MRSPASRGKKVAVIVSRSDGTVDRVNDAAAALLGDRCEGAACWRAVGDRVRGDAAPCSPGCAGRLMDVGAGHAAAHRVEIDGRGYDLACAPVGDKTVSMLTPTATGSIEGERALSPRELDVLRGLSRGEALHRIAASLGIGVPTVRTHVEHMRRKLGVTTQAGLVSAGFARGYLP